MCPVVPFAWTCNPHGSSELWESPGRGFTLTLWRKWTLRLRTNSRYFNYPEELPLWIRSSWTLWYFLFNTSFLWSWRSSWLTQLPWSFFHSKPLKLWLMLNTLFSALNRKQVIPGVGKHQKVSVSLWAFHEALWDLVPIPLHHWPAHLGRPLTLSLLTLSPSPLAIDL